MYLLFNNNFYLDTDFFIIHSPATHKYYYVIFKLYLNLFLFVKYNVLLIRGREI